MWDGESYDAWYETFQGAVENRVDRELLRPYLPKNKDAKILDAGGGTGRVALPLAKMGYSVTLGDLSSSMLQAAKRKMDKAGVSDKVDILQCDNRHLPFSDENFDFVLCWDGAFEARKELIRVTRKGGGISLFLVNKWTAAISDFHKNPESALTLARSSPSYTVGREGKHRAVDPEEARVLFEDEGISGIDIFAVCGWTDLLHIPEDVLESHDWDEKFFEQTVAMALRMCREPSLMGMTRHLVVYGVKI